MMIRPTADMHNRTVLLKRNVFFQRLDDVTLEDLAPKFSLRHYRRRDHVWWQGDRSETFAIIEEGYAKIVKHSTGGKDILLELLGPGDVMGAVALLEGRPYPASACALSDLSLLVLSREAFLEAIAQNPTVAVQALAAIGARLAYAHEMMRQFAIECVESRIASLFLLLASKASDEGSDGTTLKIRLSRKDIAETVGTAMETAIRVLSRWEKACIVKRERGRIVILDMDALKEAASEESFQLITPET